MVKQSPYLFTSLEIHAKFDYFKYVKLFQWHISCAILELLLYWNLPSYLGLYSKFTNLSKICAIFYRHLYKFVWLSKFRLMSQTTIRHLTQYTNQKYF
jgi:hypothetical protein